MAGGTIDESFFRSTEFKLAVLEYREQRSRTKDIPELQQRVLTLEQQLQALIKQLTQGVKQ